MPGPWQRKVATRAVGSWPMFGATVKVCGTIADVGIGEDDGTTVGKDCGTMAGVGKINWSMADN